MDLLKLSYREWKVEERKDETKKVDVALMSGSFLLETCRAVEAR